MAQKKLHQSLFVQVLFASVLGVAVGYFFPYYGQLSGVFGTAFIKLIKMVISPIIFCTVVCSIASMEDLKKVGTIGGKAILYFEVLTSFALVIGYAAAKIIRPGSGMNVDLSKMDLSQVASYTKAPPHHTIASTLLNIIPDTVIGAFAKGDLLQVLFLSILVGIALSLSGESGKPALRGLHIVSQILFKIVDIIMLAAPFGAFGALAYTVGQYGIGSLTSLGILMATFYLTCAIFICGVLGAVAHYTGYNIFRFLYYIRGELTTVLATSSSETVLPSLMNKLTKLGCSEAVVGLVVPTGYSFNLDGSCIYFTLGALFIAQATHTHLTFVQEMSVLGILLLTSKGAAGVTGSGFIILAATLSSVGTIPVAGVAIIFGIDRFMSQARAFTNVIGNGVASLVISKWENQLDYKQLHTVLYEKNDPI